MSAYAESKDFSDGLLRQLDDWHGGQWSDVYRLLSSKGDVSIDVVSGAARELSRSLSDARQRKGHSKKDLKELAAAIDRLEYIASKRSRGQEPI